MHSDCEAENCEQGGEALQETSGWSEQSHLHVWESLLELVDAHAGFNKLTNTILEVRPSLYPRFPEPPSLRAAFEVQSLS